MLKLDNAEFEIVKAETYWSADYTTGWKSGYRVLSATRQAMGVRLTVKGQPAISAEKRTVEFPSFAGRIAGVFRLLRSAPAADQPDAVVLELASDGPFTIVRAAPDQGADQPPAQSPAPADA